MYQKLISEELPPPIEERSQYAADPDFCVFKFTRMLKIAKRRRGVYVDLAQGGIEFKGYDWMGHVLANFYWMNYAPQSDELRIDRPTGGLVGCNKHRFG